MDNHIVKPKNFTLVWYKSGSNFKEMIGRLETKSIKRFRNKLKLIKNQNDYYLRVSYTDRGDNIGYYTNKKDLLFALDAFCDI